jgi:hypothetical protein
MKVGMMQPSFMPWQGFFELIVMSDIFIFLDDFQFSVQSYHQRNRLFVNREQVDWYTVPVRKSLSFKAALNQTQINEEAPWREKMWKRIKQNYAKAPYFSGVGPLFEQWIKAREPSLAAQNISFIRFVCRLLEIEREFRLSSEFALSTRSSQRVLDLLEQCGADTYYCARGSFGYMHREGIFPKAHIEVLFQDFEPCPYTQIGSPHHFVPFLSIMDALFNVGPGPTAEMVKGGTRAWQSWNEMVMKSSAAETAPVDAVWALQSYTGRSSCVRSDKRPGASTFPEGGIGGLLPE